MTAPLLKENIQISTGGNFNSAQVRFLKDLPQNQESQESKPQLESKSQEEKMEDLKNKLACFGIKTNCTWNKLLAYEREIEEYFLTGKIPEYFMST